MKILVPIDGSPLSLVALRHVIAMRRDGLNVELVLAKNKVKGPSGTAGPQTGLTWNIWEWEITG